jgi:hypothetical protein
MTTAMPDRIARLPRDIRGYPIPFNVLRADDGTPFFTVNDDRTHLRCIREGLCPLCGERLGKWKWFVGGPKSAFDPHGWYFDLPGHHECERYALAVCPYLAMPKYLKRVDVPHPEKLPNALPLVLLDQTPIEERPEIFVALAGQMIEVADNSPMLPYVRPSYPRLGYEFWRHGKQFTEAEAMPFLRQALGAEFRLPEVAV